MCPFVEGALKLKFSDQLSGLEASLRSFVSLFCRDGAICSLAMSANGRIRRSRFKPPCNILRIDSLRDCIQFKLRLTPSSELLIHFILNLKGKRVCFVMACAIEHLRLRQTRDIVVLSLIILRSLLLTPQSKLVKLVLHETEAL